jgi:hypothetical protein
MAVHGGQTYLRFIRRATLRMAMSPVTMAAWSTRCVGSLPVFVVSLSWYFLMLLGADGQVSSAQSRLITVELTYPALLVIILLLLFLISDVISACRFKGQIL